MKAKRFWAAAAAAAILAVMVGMVGTGTPASASSPQPRDIQHCIDQPSANFCGWTQTWYAGDMLLSPAVDPGNCYDLTVYGDVWWSYVNLSGAAQRVWENPDCTGRNVLLGHGDGLPTPSWPAKGLGGY